MKNWMRIFLVCLILIGGTAVFAFWLLGQFNNELDNLSALSTSNFVVAKTPPAPVSDKSNKIVQEQISAPVDTTSTSTPSTDPADTKISFIFPKKGNEIYMGCTYKLSFQSSSAVRSLEPALIDAGSRDTIDSGASGLATEYKLEPDYQSLNWKVGAVWPGEYYIKVSNINGTILRSKVFTISEIPDTLSADERKKFCEDSAN